MKVKKEETKADMQIEEVFLTTQDILEADHGSIMIIEKQEDDKDPTF